MLVEILRHATKYYYWDRDLMMATSALGIARLIIEGDLLDEAVAKKIIEQMQRLASCVVLQAEEQEIELTPATRAHLLKIWRSRAVRRPRGGGWGS